MLLIKRKGFIFKAFTLAEVLITLGIIGVVAAMTIPTLMQKTKDVEFKVAYKKAFSDLSNTWNLMNSKSEVVPCPDYASLNNDSCTYQNFEIFKSYMKVNTDCDSSTVANCWDMSGEALNQVLKRGSGEIQPNASDSGANSGAIAFTDLSGRSWAMMRGGFLEDVVIAVDTNGFKKPNQFGKDRFVFYGVNEYGHGAWPSHPCPGTVLKIVPSPDRISSEQDCGYPPCYGTNWLYGAN